jgi:hypothetical protein
LDFPSEGILVSFEWDSFSFRMEFEGVLFE